MKNAQLKMSKRKPLPPIEHVVPVVVTDPFALLMTPAERKQHQAQQAKLPRSKRQVYGS